MSIKTAAALAAAKAATVCLSDARRVWSWNQPLILVVGLYDQIDKVKQFHTVYEFHFRMTEGERKRLYGELTLEEVTDFHEHLKTFGLGEHEAASDWAKKRKLALAPRATGAIQLNPKIDSKKQRRLQCSAPLERLKAACDNTCEYTGATGGYRGLPLPFEVRSSRRQRKPKSPRQPAETLTVQQPESQENVSSG